MSKKTDEVIIQGGEFIVVPSDERIPDRVREQDMASPDEFQDLVCSERDRRSIQRRVRKACARILGRVRF